MQQYTEIGKRIKERREELGISAVDLADMVSISKSTLHRYENGEIKNIKMTMVDALANALKVNPSWLLGKTDIKETSINRRADYTDLGFALGHFKDYIMEREGLHINDRPLTDRERVAFVSVLDFAEKMLKGE